MPGCTEIPPAQVHLWCCPFLEIEDQSLLREYRKRPEVVSEDIHARRLSFSVTHTSDLIILGVTRDEALGIDTENVKAPRRCPEELATAFFAPAEADELRNLPASRRMQRFYEYWTLKEAYVKARAMGLAIPLHQFCFYFSSQGEIRVRFEASLRDSESRWRFWQFWVSPDHLTAVCAEYEHPLSQSLQLKKVIPLVGAEELEYKHWRTSKAQGV